MKHPKDADVIRAIEDRLSSPEEFAEDWGERRMDAEYDAAEARFDALREG